MLSSYDYNNLNYIIKYNSKNIIYDSSYGVASIDKIGWNNNEILSRTFNLTSTGIYIVFISYHACNTRQMPEELGSIKLDFMSSGSTSETQFVNTIFLPLTKDWDRICSYRSFMFFSAGETTMYATNKSGSQFDTIYGSAIHVRLSKIDS